MDKIIFASRNEGKIREVREILKNDFEVLSIDGIELPEVVEDGKTFEENAKKKAFEVYNQLFVPIIADDSGISVEQLNGLPGVDSKIFAGENATDEMNNQKLINEISKFNPPHLAKYVCCAVYYDGKNLISTFGECEGRITTTPNGANGFGYDPFFLPNGFNVTMAEIDAETKNKISHRFKAFSLLKELIKKNGDEL